MIRGMKRLPTFALALSLIGPAALASDATPRHGLSVFGNLKYADGFAHFDYVDPNAPKGGSIKITGLETFETVNPFILKGRKDLLSEPLMFDTLMARSFDEPDSFYGLVAKSVEQPDDRSWVAFNIDYRAKFHDGSPITAEDVVWTFDTLRKDGDPRFRITFRDVDRAEATGRLRVKFKFKSGIHRDLPTRLAALPVLSKEYYAGRTFNETTFDPPLASGPYRIEKLEPGRSITYRRAEDYWAKDLPVMRGRFNFDRIIVEYYRDREIAFQAFFSQQYDFREEFTSRQWASQYNKPAVNKGLIVRETLPDETPSGVQAFILNLRRDKFKDMRVRKAMDLAFDFEWTNRTLFYDLYKRTNSMFENSRLAAHEPPSQAELALMEPLRGNIPDEVFTTPFVAPINNGTGHIRGNLKKAGALLRQAGYSIRNGVLVDGNGNPLEIEFLLFEASFKRILNPYILNLKRLGINAFIRIVDTANFKRRQDKFEFDVVIRRISQPLTPGLEQRNYFGSEFANVEGSFNIGGVSDPAVDALIEKVIGAKSRDGLRTAVRALDRVLMWNRFVVPQWYKGEHNVAYWNKFGRPKTAPSFDIGVLDTWWFDTEKAKLIEQGKAPPMPPGALQPPGAK